LFQICDLIKEYTDKLEANEKIQIPANYGINVFTTEFEDKPVLNADLIVSSWYSHGQGYDYLNELTSPSKEIGTFIVMHMMCIITFLELSVYCYIKYNIMKIVKIYRKKVFDHTRETFSKFLC